MIPYKKATRRIAVSMASVLAVSGLWGCGTRSEEDMVVVPSSEKTEDSPNSSEEKAMGRYLEEDVSLPEGCSEIRDICSLTDGRLALVYRDSSYKLLLTYSADNGATWEEGAAVTELLGLTPEDNDGLLSLALAKDGGLFGGRYLAAEDSSQSSSMDYFYCSPDGQAKELPLSGIIKEGFTWHSRFGSNGNLFLAPLGDGIKEINPADGSLVHSYEDGSTADFFGISGKTLTVITDNTVHYYDTETGKPLDGMDALTSQITSEPDNLQSTSTSSDPILFLEGDEEGTIFYLDHNGMYRYAFGGNVVEQIIDGSLNSIGSPGTSFTAITADGDGSFYLGSTDFSSGNPAGKLYRYTYSKDTPSVPDTELTVYALKDNSFIRQAAAVFQKKYPDIYLNLETGMTGDDAVTSTDALKTLNTEIMAGKGPDILLLDGIPADTYIEKGLLSDLSGLLSEDGLLENIKNAYTEEDGAVYTMPVKFGIPMIQGYEEDINAITDLTAMADVLEKHREEYVLTSAGYTLPLLSAFGPRMLLESLADSSSAAWLKKDGTLDEALIKDFLKQSGRIYQTSAELLPAISEQTGADVSALDAEGYDRTLGVSSGSLSVLGHTALLSTGGLYTPLDLTQVDSVNKAEPSITAKLWDGQAKNCFIPVNTIGISAKSTEKEAAEDFIRFLFSEDGQQITTSGGFPVVQSVYESDSYWDQGGEGTVVMSSSSYNSATGTDSYFEFKAPSPEVVKSIQELGKTLTSPVADNEIILNAVVSNGVPYLKGETDLDKASAAILQEVNLYLSE